MRYMKIFILLFALMVAVQCMSNTTNRPNIIIYLADDLGMKDVGVYGAKVVKTPHLDALAKQGMVMDCAFIASPACAPSRAAMLTGLMPARNGAEENHSYPKAGVDVLTKILQKNGYKVYAFGKVAHGKMNNECGFDFYHEQKVNLAQNVKAFFEKTQVEGPVCLMVGDRRPHVLWTKDSKYSPDDVDLPSYFIDTKETREHRARYYTDVTGFDQTMGEILTYTDKILGENSVVMVSSDHGAQWPFAKWNLYDASIRTPFIVKWNGMVAAGTRSDAMISWVDIFPTILELTGSEIPDGLDGQSFLNVILGEKQTHREVIYTTHSGDGIHNVYPIRSIRTRKFKYIRNLLPDCYHTNHSDLYRKDGAGAYWNSWDKLAENDENAAAIIKKYYQRPAEEFYNLENDPNEQNNVMDDVRYKKQIEKMSKMLDEWMKEQDDQKTVFREPYPLSGPKPDTKMIDEIKGNR